MADLIQFEDHLRIEGINFKGFGILPKYVMVDHDLSIEAKTIYAYFCSFAGNGDSPFPGRDKILIDLPMSKDAYYKHFKLLSEQGYILVAQQKQEHKFHKNVYTLVSNPKKITESLENFTDNPYYSRICFSGLKSFGYGMIPKAVMIDTRLPVKAKGVYAYFCSYTGSGDNAFPNKDQILYHLQITEKTYYKFYKILTDLNYITAVQRHVDGRLQVNDYYLNDAPDAAFATKKTVLATSVTDTKLQDGKKQDTGKLQDGKKQDTRKQDGKKQDTRKQDTTINNPNINSFNINSLNNPSISLSDTRDITPEREEGASECRKDEIVSLLLTEQKMPYHFNESEADMTTAIHFITDWDVKHPNGYQNEFEQKVYNLFNQALIDMCCTSRTMNLKGDMVTCIKVIDKINELCKFKNTYIDMTDISEPAMDSYIKGSKNTEINNPLQYMKSCIWDAMKTENINLYGTLFRDGLLNV